MGPKAVINAISQIKNCQTKAEAGRLAKKIVKGLGAESYIYALVLPPGVHSPEANPHFLIGCDETFCRIYAERMWSLNDPFLDYARCHVTPAVNTTIPKLTPGQIEMAECGAKYGFRSGLVIPTHTCMGASQRMGLFYVGSSQERPIGEPLLLARRAEFAALSSELLWWMCAFLKQQAMDTYQLTEQEMLLLTLAKSGKVGEEMAAILNLSLSIVYRRLRHIKHKMNVKRIERAVIEAQACGLLE
ncbi:autoinducer binding domain-containing protein [Neisseriaceae bacterium TC5R-5]|nr:autoinducer binding domain-containing protein [Neisseriaceae bacterium TC5R-5]